MAENRVRYGLKRAYYAPVTLDAQDVPTFGTPVRLPGAVSITLDANAEQEIFYADDIAYFVTNAMNGYDGTLELALVPEQFEKDCLGVQEDTDGLLVESASDMAKYFALMFEFTGDVKAIRHCLYYCKASRGSTEGETKGETAEVKTEELNFTASPLPGSEIIKAKTGPNTADARYNSWYESVALPNLDGDDGE